jgi:hypothetical protein
MLKARGLWKEPVEEVVETEVVETAPAALGTSIKADPGKRPMIPVKETKKPTLVNK